MLDGGTADFETLILFNRFVNKVSWDCHTLPSKNCIASLWCLLGGSGVNGEAKVSQAEMFGTVGVGSFRLVKLPNNPATPRTLALSDPRRSWQQHMVGISTTNYIALVF